MITDLDNLTQSFLLPRRTLTQRLNAAALDSGGVCRFRTFDNSKWFATYKADYFRDARRLGVQFPDGEDAVTFITRRYRLNRQLGCLMERCDDILPIKPIWTFLKCVTRGVDPKITRDVLGNLTEKLILMGKVNPRDAAEDETEFHVILMCAIRYVRRGWTRETLSAFDFEYQ